MADEKNGANSTNENETTEKTVVVVFGNSQKREVNGEALVEQLNEIKTEFEPAAETFKQSLMAEAMKNGNIDSAVPLVTALMDIAKSIAKATPEKPVLSEVEFSGILGENARKKMVQQLMASNNVTEEVATKELQPVTGFKPERSLQTKIGQYFKAATEYKEAVKHNETIENKVTVETSLNGNADAVKHNAEITAKIAGMKPAEITEEFMGSVFADFILQFGKIRKKTKTGDGSNEKQFGAIEQGTVKFTLNGKTCDISMGGTEMLNEIAKFGVPVDEIGSGVYLKHKASDGTYTNSKNGSEPKFRHVAAWLSKAEGVTDAYVAVVKPSKTEGIEDETKVFLKDGKYASKGL